MTNEKFLQHFSHLLEAPNGIQKMREIILRLAMQGRLVAQAGKDEAADLIDRLIKKRQSTANHKNITNPKPAIAHEDKEGLHPIPKHWEWCRLSDIGHIFNGNSINARVKREKYEGLEEGLPYIATKDVGYGRTKLHYDNGVRIPNRDSSFKIAHANSVLICSEGGSAGKKIGITEQDICFGNKLYAIEASSGIDPLFVFYYYQTPMFFSMFKAKMTGIIGGISLHNFVALPIPLPPTDEQHRIVAKVDDLMTLCDRLETERNARDATHGSLIRAVHQTLTETNEVDANQTAWYRVRDNFADIYSTLESVFSLRHSILQLAVQGRLVPQNPDEAPAIDLLRRIRADVDVRRAERNMNRRSLPALRQGEKPFELPDGWVWERLGNLLEAERDISYGIIKLGVEPRSGGVKTLRCSDVRFRKITPDKARTVERKLSREYSRTVLHGGEILMNIRGTLGGCGLVSQDLAGSNIAREVAMIPVHRQIVARYILDVISSPLIQENTLNSLRGIAYKGLNLGLLRNFPIPIPPLSEQRRIVKKIDELMELCDKLEASIRDRNDTANRYSEAVAQQIAAA